jgi:two-component system sensor histidine kinase RpfC
MAEGFRGGLRQAIAAAPQQEFEQTQLRVYIWGAILAYLVCYVLRNGKILPTEWEVLAVTTGFFAFSIALVVLVLVTGRDSVRRRFVGMIGDNAVATYFMIQMGEAGAVILFVYLWITFGNGFRYGRVYLHASQLMGIVGFSIVLLLSPFWSRHLWIGTGVLIGLILLPNYVGYLAERIKEARKTAEEACKHAEAAAAERASAYSELLAAVREGQRDLTDCVRCLDGATTPSVNAARDKCRAVGARLLDLITKAQNP